MRIFIPIPIRTSPPKIWIFFSKKCPTLLPITSPDMETKTVITAIIKVALIIGISKKAKPIPTARASMLVARPSIHSFLSSKGVFGCLDGHFCLCSKIILRPMAVKSENAIQWSIPVISSLSPYPANHPRTGIIP